MNGTLLGASWRRLIIIASIALLLKGALPALALDNGGQAQQAVYTCPMDPDVKSARPGSCPKCGMALRVAVSGASETRGEGKAPSRRPEGRVDNLQIPEATVFDQDGRKLRFYSDLVKGKTVAINFIFTTCTTICPPLTATFRSVQKTLGARVGQDIALISVSVDPAVDIPERLKSFAEKFHAGQGWTFVTGSQAEVDKLLEALGASVANKNDHTPMILVGNERAHYWTRAYGLAPASKLVKIITDAADSKTDRTD